MDITNRKYAIGLDVGIGIGWSIVLLNKREEPAMLYDFGVHCFDKSENPKNNETLNVARRAARSSRRIIRRRRLRKKEIKEILRKHNIIDDMSFCNEENVDPYELRFLALERVLSRDELATVLIHISQRRGFKSNRTHDRKNEEDGKVLDAVKNNESLLSEKGYRTVGEMLYKDPLYSERKRNTTGNYTGVVSRAMIESEVNTIFEQQRAYGSVIATEELQSEYLGRLLAQRNFDEGPGLGSPRYGNQIENMVGKCTFFPDEKRAATATFSNEYRNLLQTVNNIRTFEGGEKKPLTDEQRKDVVDFALSHKEVSYKQIRKLLSIDPDVDFCISYSQYEDKATAESKTKIQALKSYHDLKKVINASISKNRFEEISSEELDNIATVLTLFKSSDRIKEELEALDVSSDIVEIADELPIFDKFASISLKACKLLIPHLENGMTYDKACVEAGLTVSVCGTKARKLHITAEDLEPITSPVAKRAIIRTAKVVNAIIDKMGYSPVYINIETTRELSHSKATKKKIEKRQKENRENNEEARAYITETFGRSKVSALDIEKYKLWREQGEICIYSNTVIPADILFTNKCEVDHIVPYSISFDNSMSNKVLVYQKENQLKAQRLPLEYLSGDDRDAFLINVDRIYNGRLMSKKHKLLKEKITDEDVNSFTRKNLQDTSLIATFLMNYLKANLEFDESVTDKKIRVNAVSGSVTAMLRRSWGLNKVRDNGDKHHAMDATVIACTTHSLINRVSSFNRYTETRHNGRSAEEDGFIVENGLVVDARTGEVAEEFPIPWNNFALDITARLSDKPVEQLKGLNLDIYDGDYSFVKPIFVSRAANHKVSGQAHKETVMSAKRIHEGYAIKKTPLQSLKLDTNGEIKDYFEPESDRLLYEALKQQLTIHGGDAKKAFKEPFYKPKADGSRGPLVKSVKTKESTTSYVELPGQGGIALKKGLLRLDIFKSSKGYEAVPVYVNDMLNNDRSLVASSGEIVNPDEFLFSIYQGDVIGFKKNAEDNEMIMYYNSFSIRTSQIEGYPHDTKKPEKRAEFIKTIRSAHMLKKYSVDILGNINEIKREKRC